MKVFSESDRLLAEKHLKVSIPSDPSEVGELSWASLHAERRKVRDASAALLDRVKKDNREINKDEESAFDMGMKYLDAISEEFDRRSVAGVKEPEADEVHRVSIGSKKTMNATMFAERKNWRSIFGREPRQAEGEISNFGEFLKAVHLGDNERLLRTM